MIELLWAIMRRRLGIVSPSAGYRQHLLEVQAQAQAGRAAAEAACPRPACEHKWSLISLEAYRRTWLCLVCGARFVSGALIHVDEDGFEARTWPRPPR